MERHDQQMKQFLDSLDDRLSAAGPRRYAVALASAAWLIITDRCMAGFVHEKGEA